MSLQDLAISARSSWPSARLANGRCVGWQASLRHGAIAESLELAKRIADDLVVLHHRASPERRPIGSLAERAAGEDLGLVDVKPNICVGNREMSRDGAGEDRRRFGLAEPGKHCGAALRVSAAGVPGTEARAFRDEPGGSARSGPR